MRIIDTHKDASVISLGQFSPARKENKLKTIICEICDGYSGTGQIFSTHFGFSLLINIPPMPRLHQFPPMFPHLTGLEGKKVPSSGLCIVGDTTKCTSIQKRKNVKLEYKYNSLLGSDAVYTRSWTIEPKRLHHTLCRQPCGWKVPGLQRGIPYEVSRDRRS
jgi:hypothetical protein